MAEGRVDLSAFLSAYNECKPIVNEMQNYIETIRIALSEIKQGITFNGAQESLYTPLATLASKLELEIGEIQKVMQNIEREHETTLKRLNQSNALV